MLSWAALTTWEVATAALGAELLEALEAELLAALEAELLAALGEVLSVAGAQELQTHCRALVASRWLRIRAV